MISQQAEVADAARAADQPRRVLTRLDGIVITVGIVIGAGIFRAPSTVAQMSGSVEWMLLAWFAGGVLSLIGALTYAELATTYPSTGGDYHFITRVYGRDISFFFAWARATVINTGSIALLGYALGDYLTQIVSLGAHSAAIYAALAVVVLTAMNIAGLKKSVRAQGWFAALETAGVLLVAVAGMWVASQLGASAAVETPAAATGIPGTFGLAMVFVLLTFGGWNEAAYVSAELHGGRRSIVSVLVISLLLISALYLLFVVAATWALGFEGLKASEAVGADVMGAAFGPIGTQIIGIIVAVAALTSMNGTMIVGARTNYAVAHDWPLFSFMNRWQGENNVPVKGFLVQAAISLALVAFGAMEKSGFAAMVEFTAPVFWFFFTLSGIALFVLRWRDPHTPRPFKVPLYPVLPLLFVATTIYLFYSSITYAQSQKAVHISFYVMGAGAVTWLLARWKRV